MGTGMRASRGNVQLLHRHPHRLGAHQSKMPVQTTHRAEGMVLRRNIKNEVGTTIGHCYSCKECAFECATRAAYVAHARRKHTDELIGPCDYCGIYYVHSADSMRHHVNECAVEPRIVIFRWLIFCLLLTLGMLPASIIYYILANSSLIIFHYMSPALPCKSTFIQPAMLSSARARSLIFCHPVAPVTLCHFILICVPVVNA